MSVYVCMQARDCEDSADNADKAAQLLRLWLPATCCWPFGIGAQPPVCVRACVCVCVHASLGHAFVDHASELTAQVANVQQLRTEVVAQPMSDPLSLVLSLTV